MSTSESGTGGLKEVIASIEGRGVLQPSEVRKRRAPGAARSGDGSERPHPHVHGHRCRAAGSRGGGYSNQREGSAHRYLLLERPRRPERQHDVLGRAADAHPQRSRRLAAGREVADQEPREGDEGAARAALRDGDAKAAGGDRRRSAAARSARANDRKRSAPTTSRRAASPTIASTSRRIACTTSSKATPAS